MNRNSILVFILISFLIGCAFYFSRNTNSAKKDQIGSLKTEQPTTQESSFTDSGSYLNYSKEKFEQMSDKKRVYFFHANWCPTCKAANSEFLANIDKIPSDTIIFKTDYDNEKELKKLYNITYQHTFVLVDSKGNELEKWNGGGIKELISNTKI